LFKQSADFKTINLGICS